MVKYVPLILVPNCRCVLCRIRADYLAAEKVMLLLDNILESFFFLQVLRWNYPKVD